MQDLISKSKIAKKIISFEGQGQDLSIRVEPKDIVMVLNYLKTDNKLRFNQLIGICGADYPANQERLEVVYLLLSMTTNHRLKVKIKCSPNDIIPSVCEIFANAIWYERETYDMYGVLFSGNPDLRRILTDYGFEGHPLLKDFPLTGHVEMRYDVEAKKVVYEPVTLTQEFRNFDFESPWEGYAKGLPGDEKASK